MGLAATFSKLLPRRAADPLGAVPFAQLAAAWERRCRAFPIRAEAATTGRRVAVLVTPWLGTPVSFFNLEIARMHAERGDQVCVIWDGASVVGNAVNAEEVAALRAALDRLPAGFEIIDVAGLTPLAADPATDEEEARRVVAEIGIWRTRGEANASEFTQRHEGSVATLIMHIGRVRRLVAESRLDWLLIPGGVWGVSGLYVAAAQRAGVRFTTYDSGTHMLIACQDGIAAHQADIPRAFELAAEFLRERSGARQRFIDWSRAELDARMRGGGNYTTFQAGAATGRQAGDSNVLVPLNLRWDSAALGRQRLFSSVQEWVTAIVRWAAEDPQARVCLRQHPIERHTPWRSSDDLGRIVADANTAGERVRFVAAAESVNTYDLLPTVRAMLPFTSSMGVEAGMLGLPVITASRNYYEHFRFATRGETVADYFEKISRAIRGELAPPAGAEEDAALVYHLTQHCNLMPSNFNAAPADFLKWVELPPEQLWAQPDTADLRTALLGGEPLSFVRLRRFAEAA